MPIINADEIPGRRRAPRSRRASAPAVPAPESAPAAPAASVTAPESAPAPESGSWFLDESGQRPVITRKPGGMPIAAFDPIIVNGVITMYGVIRIITAPTSAMTFAECVKWEPATGTAEVGPDGRTALRYLIKRGSGGEKPRPGIIVWVGTIDVTSKYRAYDITGDRTLEKIESSRHITVRVSNNHGKVTTAEIPMMNLRATGDRAQWIDDLDLHESNQTSALKTLIIALAGMEDGDTQVIHGQGPVYLEDGKLAYATKSVVYDSKGNPRTDVRADLNAVIKQAALRYYDITPRLEITDDQIRAGIRDLRDALTESPDYPEIPAAFTGQMYTSPLAAIYRELWSGIHMSGTRGSGKTHYATRWDAIQSRTHRASLRNVRPVLPLGDTTGTVKGQQYRSAGYGGFAITTDDVIKSGDTEFRIGQQNEKMQSITRSFETGGSARATVDRARNKVTDGNAPELASSMKITTEVPLSGDSLRNRLIVLPHITDTWGRGGYFDRKTSERLTAPESIERQHRGWSAYVHWLFVNHTIIPETLADARAKTDLWDLADARMSERYSVIVAGHMLFTAFCASLGIDYAEDAQRAATALKNCAQRQAGNMIPLAERFAEMLRREIVNGKLAYPGPPLYADGSETEYVTYSAPGIASDVEDAETGVSRVVRDMAGYSYGDLGMTIGTSGDVAKPAYNAGIRGYLNPPRTDKGGKANDPLTREWLIVHKRAQFAALCEQLTRAAREYGWNFTPDSVIKSLRDIGKGNNARLSVGGKQDRYIYIDAAFALKSTDSE